MLSSINVVANEQHSFDGLNSMPCASCVKSGLAPRLVKQIQNKMKEVDMILGQSFACCLIKRNGELIPSNNNSAADNLQPGEVSTILSLKSAAFQLGQSMKESTCSVIRIRGATTLFSCYEVGNDADVCLQCYKIPNIIHQYPTLFYLSETFTLIISQVLVVYTQMTKQAGDKFNFENADQKIQTICEELRSILTGHHAVQR
ncbi:hypothetical protein PROFUN_09766 [Planoprotostelium fungivorum]|uniref:Roadblock/LAMTOR2 domain-containing protein n=1 Tax=Planoprotostelium fungivorum TaxID=1890364 RepID=A0A2P6NFF0_9EUKA|nr:hypothetical protein PROFUN_09766 [Planoprotostelium fungivorum]